MSTSSSSVARWPRVVRSGAVLVALALALPPVSAFVYGAVSSLLSSSGAWDASVGRSVVDVVAWLALLAGAWRLTATPLVPWWTRLVIVGLVLVAGGGVLLKLGDDPRFTLTSLAAHALSGVATTAEIAIALIARHIDTRSSGDRSSVLWLIVIALYAVPLLARLDSFSLFTALVLGLVGLVRVGVFVVALLRLRPLHR